MRRVMQVLILKEIENRNQKSRAQKAEIRVRKSEKTYEGRQPSFSWVNYSRPRSEIKSELVFSGEKEGCVKTRWKRFYQKQMENVELRGSVGSEAENLQLVCRPGRRQRRDEGEMARGKPRLVAGRSGSRRWMGSAATPC